MADLNGITSVTNFIQIRPEDVRLNRADGQTNQFSPILVCVNFIHIVQRTQNIYLKSEAQLNNLVPYLQETHRNSVTTISRLIAFICYLFISGLFDGIVSRRINEEWIGKHMEERVAS
jgi:hypothetical protein